VAVARAAGALAAVMLLLLLSFTASAADWPTEPDPAPWTVTASGIEVQDRVVGTGAEVNDGAGVEVHYVGMLADGTVFDASRERGQAFTFRVGQHVVIRGWEEGVLGMRIGGTRRLVIPASEGYGSKAVGPIPPDSVLYFEIELLGVTAPRAAPAAPAAVPDEDWVVLRSGVRCADLVVGEGPKATPGHRVCIDWVTWRDGRAVDQTFARERCTWLRLDDGDLPPLVEEGLAKMRAGGTREIVLPTGETWHVELTDAAK
jgi:peptidylprolyl isomerase